METLKAILTNPFFWGFVLGFTFCVLSVVAHWKTKGELRRLKGHLSDKLEIEAEKMSEMKEKLDLLKQENENLRIKVNAGRSQSDAAELKHNLEIYARAENAMVVNAPGFAPAWQRAKEAALAELEAEESGKKPARNFFRKFFRAGAAVEEGETIEALPSDSANKRHAPAGEA